MKGLGNAHYVFVFNGIDPNSWLRQADPMFFLHQKHHMVIISILVIYIEGNRFSRIFKISLLAASGWSTCSMIQGFEEKIW